MSTFQEMAALLFVFVFETIGELARVKYELAIFRQRSSHVPTPFLAV